MTGSPATEVQDLDKDDEIHYDSGSELTEIGESHEKPREHRGRERAGSYGHSEATVVVEVDEEERSDSGGRGQGRGAREGSRGSWRSRGSRRSR